MIDFAWSEFLVVIIVAVLVIGPKQLPEVLHGLGRIVRRLQYMKFAMSKQFDDFMEQSDLRELREQAQKHLSAPDLLAPHFHDEAEFDEPIMTPIEHEPKAKAEKSKQGNLPLA